MDLPPPEIVRKWFRYDAETGFLYRGAVKVGRRDKFGHLRAPLRWGDESGGYPVHRIAWCVYHGSWPSGVIDHINGKPDDNRLTNLRDVSRSDNNKNMSMSSRNTSGVVGVSWARDRKKWRAKIKSQNIVYELGFFSDFEDAVRARREAEREHGFHKNHGRKKTLDDMPGVS